MRTLFAFAILLGILFSSSCKKDDSAAPPPSLKGKWNVESVHWKSVENGSVTYDENYTGQSTDHLDFRNDNKAEISLDGATDVVDYTLSSNSKVTIDGEEFTIQQLTEHHARLYLKYTYDNTTYDEVTMNLKR